MRRGAALLIALAALVAAMAAAAASQMHARASVAVVTRREREVRAVYAAEGCLVRRRVELQAALADAQTPSHADSVWLALDRVPSGLDAECDVCASPAGRVVDVNSPDTVLIKGVLARRYPTTASDIASRLRFAGQSRTTPADPTDLSLSAEFIGARKGEQRPFASNDELLLAVGGLADSSLLEVLGVEDAPLWMHSLDAQTLLPLPVGSSDTTALPMAWFVRAAVPMGLDSSEVHVRWRLSRNGRRLSIAQVSTKTSSGRAGRRRTDCE